MSEKEIREKSYYVSSMIEEYKRRHGAGGKEVFESFKKKGVLSWLWENFGVLHTEDERAVLKEIESMVS